MVMPGQLFAAAARFFSSAGFFISDIMGILNCNKPMSLIMRGALPVSSET
jgi:hypothetical protein